MEVAAGPRKVPGFKPSMDETRETEIRPSFCSTSRNAPLYTSRRKTAQPPLRLAVHERDGAAIVR